MSKIKEKFLELWEHDDDGDPLEPITAVCIGHVSDDEWLKEYRQYMDWEYGEDDYIDPDRPPVLKRAFMRKQYIPAHKYTRWELCKETTRGAFPVTYWDFPY